MGVTRAFVTEIGVVSGAGVGLSAQRDALVEGRRHLGPMTLFPLAPAHDHPVGQVRVPLVEEQDLPRAHRLALTALSQLSTEGLAGVDCICLGTTTGGVDVTEGLLLRGEKDSRHYRYHGLDTVAQTLVRAVTRVGGASPAQAPSGESGQMGSRLSGESGQMGSTGTSVATMTFSTACSSGAVALLAGLELIRCGMARRVLAGGVESLCRLTCCGFSLLQIVDPGGARPLDVDRRGMSVAEGAALLLLEASDSPPPGAMAELRGGGLSCDAYHPTAPDPNGAGARRAMELAIEDAGLSAHDVSYINLHGTGTPDNDAAEARAVATVFPSGVLLSSTKGAFGHTLAASGGLEAAVATICLREGLIPSNVGLRNLDRELGLDPCREVVRTPVAAVLSNSLGFGGNNASLVLTRPDPVGDSSPAVERISQGSMSPLIPSHGRGPSGATWAGRLWILSAACLSGAGSTEATWETFSAGLPCAGSVDGALLAARFGRREDRRLKRLARLACWVAEESLALARGQDPAEEAGREIPRVDGIFWGTGWGALTETHRFLDRLAASKGAFSSPIDFSSSVHNAVAGQLAIRLGARGPNITSSGRASSLWQAALSASLLAQTGAQLLVVGDEHHGVLTPLLQEGSGASPADGAAAFVVSTEPWPELPQGSRPYLAPLAPPAPTSPAQPPPGSLEDLLGSLGGGSGLRERFAAVWLGQPPGRGSALAAEPDGTEHLPREERLPLPCGDLLGDDLPVILFRLPLGDYPTVTGVAAVLALRAAREGLWETLPPKAPWSLVPRSGVSPGKPHLIVELGADGEACTALEVGWS